MVKNLPCSVRTVGLIPVRGTKILHAMGQLNPHLTVRASLHHHKISHMMDAVMILHAASKTRCSQISKYSKTKMQKLGPYFRPTEPEFLRPRPFLVKKFPRGFLWLLFIPASQATAIVFGLLEVPKLRVVKAKEEKTFYLCVRIMGFVDGSVVKIPPGSQEYGDQSLRLEDPLEEATATHSSILVWRIPWTEEPGTLQSTGSQRIRHN